jgi:DNA-binding transcriptional MerR regulator
LAVLDKQKLHTIKEAADIMNMTPVTLRYYDKQGLLPFLERRESGYRVFSENDILMLRVIECLKQSGMSIKEIRQFVHWVQEGDNSLQERYAMFLERKLAVETQMAELQKTLDFINHKCWYYETSIAAGTEKIHFEDLPCQIFHGRAVHSMPSGKFELLLQGFHLLLQPCVPFCQFPVFPRALLCIVLAGFAVPFRAGFKFFSKTMLDIFLCFGHSIIDGIVLGFAGFSIVNGRMYRRSGGNSIFFVYVVAVNIASIRTFLHINCHSAWYQFLRIVRNEREHGCRFGRI